MADIQIIDGSGDGESWRVAFHLDVPNVNNDVGVNFRTALINSGIGLNLDTNRRTILPSGTGPGQITTAEEALLDNGTLFERVVMIPAESGGKTNAQRLATVREYYAREDDDQQQQIGEKLRYFGFTTTRVP